MTESVDKLKALLFQPESEAIASLSKRIDSVFERAGTTERFQASVATVLDSALRDAEVARHDELSNAIAPLIVQTVKTEIRGSTDELVEALYPATGRMVKAYIASAIKDLTDQINARLEQNPVMSRLSGRSAGEVALAESQRLKVEDVFLIRRASGELLSRFPEGTQGSNHDHVMGGVLTAINEFTSEAFKAEGSALRQIDLGGSRVYLRVSPSFLLAARCSGQAPVGAEGVLDDAFLALTDRLHEGLSAAQNGAAGPPGSVALLRELAANLEHRLGALQAPAPRRGIAPLYLLLGLIAVPLALWLAWTSYRSYRVGSIRDTASAILMAEPGMRGYPAEIKVAADAASVSLTGLAPTAGVKTHVINELSRALPDVAVRDQLNTVPEGSADPMPAFLALKAQAESDLQDLRRQVEDERTKRRDGELQIAELTKAAETLRAEIAALPRPQAPTAREELTSFVGNNAVFFSEFATFRDEAATTRILEKLARILKKDPDLIVRVIGFTDEIGSPSNNANLADTRAATVARALEALGVSKRQLVELHRTSPDYNVSPAKGPGSANRRVEFEAGFIGESPP